MKSSTISNLALLASSLLVGEVLAAPYDKRQDVVVTVTQQAGSPSPTESPDLAPSNADMPAPAPNSDQGSSPSGGDGGKRGLPYGDASLLGSFAGSKASWCYNWDSKPGNIPKGLSYVPMLHGLDPDHLTPWAKDAADAIAAGATHLQYINEPDVAVENGGVNTSPSDAAAGYKHMMDIKAQNQDVKIGSPAVSNGLSGGPQGDMGIPFIKKFWAACDGCKFDFVAFHWYGNSVDELKTQVEAFHDAAKAEPKVAKDANGEPTMWLTEFGINGGENNPDKIAQFLGQDGALDWLDKQPYLERYAYQWVADKFLVSGTQPNVAGKAYIS